MRYTQNQELNWQPVPSQVHADSPRPLCHLPLKYENIYLYEIVVIIIVVYIIIVVIITAPDKPIISRLDYEAGTDYVVVSWRPVEEGKARNPASRHYVEHRKAGAPMYNNLNFLLFIFI